MNEMNSFTHAKHAQRIYPLFGVSLCSVCVAHKQTWLYKISMLFVRNANRDVEGILIIKIEKIKFLYIS